MFFIQWTNKIIVICIVCLLTLNFNIIIKIDVSEINIFKRFRSNVSNMYIFVKILN